MQNFEFYSPTKMIFGADTQATLSKHIADFGGSRILLHYGGNSALKSGLIDELRNQLKTANIHFVELGGVLPNPRLKLVREGIDLCRIHNLDMIIAVGGGSVIDSAKAIGVGVKYTAGDVWDLFTQKATPTDCLPIGCILTIASAGSESSKSCVIRNEDEPTKRGILTDIIRPKFAILNPELTYGLSPFQLACGISDIIMHTLDRYFTDATATDITDRISEGLISTVMAHGTVVMKDPEHYPSHANIMWAGSLSHNTLTGLGKPFDFSVHALERGVSGGFDTAHAAGLTALWGHWARFVYKDNLMKFCQFAVNVHGVEMDFENPEKTAMLGIEKMEAFFKSINMPTTLRKLMADSLLTAKNIDAIANYATANGTVTVGTFRKLNKSEVIKILNNSINF